MTGIIGLIVAILFCFIGAFLLFVKHASPGCPRCGCPVLDAANFCGRCGFMLKSHSHVYLWLVDQRDMLKKRDEIRRDKAV